MNVTPPEPTPEQCSGRAKVAIPGHPDLPAHALWWPQQGGYVGKAVVTIGDCSELWLWHDGQHPTNGGAPQQIHLDSYQSWIDTFTWLQERYEIEYNGEPTPYVLRLPRGVTREEAEHVHAKILEWGMWDPDPGGFEIQTYEEWALGRPCVAPPCPPWQGVELSIEPLIDEAARPLDDEDSEYAPQSHPTAAELAAAMMPRMYEIAPDQILPDGTIATGAWLRDGQDGGVVYLGDAAQPPPDFMAGVYGGPGFWDDARIFRVDTAPPPASEPGRTRAQGVFKWMDVTIPWEGELPPDIARSFFPGPYSLAPTIDLGHVLEQDLRDKSVPIYPEFPSPDYPYATDDHPLIVSVPTGVDAQRVSEAIALCQQVGLIAPTPRGVLYLPAELDEAGY